MFTVPESFIEKFEAFDVKRKSIGIIKLDKESGMFVNHFESGMIHYDKVCPEVIDLIDGILKNIYEYIDNQEYTQAMSAYLQLDHYAACINSGMFDGLDLSDFVEKMYAEADHFKSLFAEYYGLKGE